MCPLLDKAKLILRHMSEDRRRSSDKSAESVQTRENKGMEQYFTEAVRSPEVQAQKGQVYPYVEQAFQRLAKQGSPENVKAWVSSQKSKLMCQKTESVKSTV